MVRNPIDSVNEEIADFDRWCQDSWGMKVRNVQLLASNIPQIRDHVNFNRTSRSLKAHIAEKLILESCGRIGAFCESGDVTWYIREFGLELRDDGAIFTGRRIQPLKAALLLLAHMQFSSALPINSSDCDHIRAGGAAMSAMYLLAHLEFLFRKKSRYLYEDGTVKQPIPETLRKKHKINNKKRINNIDLALILYLYRNNSAKCLQVLEKKLGIARRLKRVRHPIMHGELPDPGFEAMFFGLLTAIFYYGA